jgi:hypothetical protein
MATIEQFVSSLNKKFPKTTAYKSVFIFTIGKRFYKICLSRDGIVPSSSYAFVDKTNGDLYKSASWNAPAKHVRGNINDDTGLEACDEYTVKYLRG